MIPAQESSHPRNSASLVIEAHSSGVPENNWLSQTGLIPGPGSEYSIEVVKDWHRPGTESYIMQFDVKTGDLSTSALVKACIKLDPTSTVNDWIQRRDTLSQNGISVPVLYSVQRGEYIEEFVPYTIREAYKAGSDGERYAIEQGFIHTYKKLFEIGFNPISMHDIRSRGDDVVLIDFGSDLGSPDIAKSSSVSTEVAADYFERNFRV